MLIFDATQPSIYVQAGALTSIQDDLSRRSSVLYRVVMLEDYAQITRDAR